MKAALVLAAAVAAVHATTYSVNIPPRYMWGWGPNVYGYCGECSLQSAGIFYGNWITQEAALQACGSECLVSDNEEAAAQTLGFLINKFTPAGPTSYLPWVLSHLQQQHAVIGTWYLAGFTDSAYDHITPITGAVTNSGGTVVGLTFNDLYLSTPRTLNVTTGTKSRSQCQVNNPVQPYQACLQSRTDYGLAITGIVDPLNVTLRTTLNVNSWSEPDDGSEDTYHPRQAPINITANATVSGLSVGHSYSILRFDSHSALPSNGNFLGTSSSHAWTHQVNFTATASTMTVTGLVPFLSNGTYFFRTVRLA